MKPFLPFLALLLLPLFSQSQSNTIPDTLLVQHFPENLSETMLDTPTGFDVEWVNWDGDKRATLCADSTSEPIPGNWYLDLDLGDLTDPPVNFAFTSCSWLEPNLPNNNWLITPPIYIPDSSVVLSWKSLSFEGPGFLDGYRVKISKNSNDPASTDFNTTLFEAAQMLKILSEGSLDPDDYVFSPGYVHADRYTLTDYFFLYPPDAYAYRGKLEPHSVSLAAFAGEVVYIAFIHNSWDDYILQIDDIAIVQGATSAAPDVPARSAGFALRPNPATHTTTIQWNHPLRENTRLTISDCLGNIVLEKWVAETTAGSLEIDLQTLPAGVYSCTVWMTAAPQTVLLVKQ